MPQKVRKENFNLTDPPFWAPFLKAFGNDSLLPYEIKCAALAAGVWALGFVHAHVMGVQDTFFEDYMYHVMVILSPFVFAQVFRVCKSLDDTFKRLNRVFLNSEAEFEGFISTWKRQSSSFYYFCVVGFAAIVLLTTSLVFLPSTWQYTSPAPWMIKLIENGTVGPLTYFNHFSSSILLGVMIGIAFNRLLYCVRIVDDYGNKFMRGRSEKIELRHLVVPEEFTSLAKLATMIAVIMVVPLFISAWIFFGGLLASKVNYGIIAYLAGSMLLFVFFSVFPLRHLHREMAEAKEREIGILDSDLQRAGKRVSGIKGFSVFHNVVVVRDRVRMVSTRGINTGLSLRFLMTFFLPIVLGALLQIWFELILPWLLTT